jgi:hypothetical protein
VEEEEEEEERSGDIFTIVEHFPLRDDDCLHASTAEKKRGSVSEAETLPDFPLLLFFFSLRRRDGWRPMVDAITSYRSIGTRLRRKRSDDRTIWFRPNFSTLLGWRERSMLGVALVTFSDDRYKFILSLL